MPEDFHALIGPRPEPRTRWYWAEANSPQIMRRLEDPAVLFIPFWNGASVLPWTQSRDASPRGAHIPTKPSGRMRHPRAPGTVTVSPEKSPKKLRRPAIFSWNQPQMKESAE